MAETMNMVERVAMAIARNELDDDEVVGFDWYALTDYVADRFRRSARAAIGAMRDEGQVTDEMLEAGRVALHAPENRHGAVLGAVFCAMCDAALSEGGE